MHSTGDGFFASFADASAAASCAVAIQRLLAEHRRLHGFAPQVRIGMHAAEATVMETDVVREADVVVTMGCGDACPVLPGKRYLDWDLPDPAGRSVDEIRAIRDSISSLVQSLLVDLVETLPPNPAK